MAKKTLKKAKKIEATKPLMVHGPEVSSDCDARHLTLLQERGVRALQSFSLEKGWCRRGAALFKSSQRPAVTNRRSREIESWPRMPSQ